MSHLEVKNLNASYGSLPVLHGVDLACDKGEVVALIGPSGSGKSTILRVLMGLTACTGGDAILDGKPIDYRSAASVRSVRDRMAIVFQQYNLFQNMDVMRNVTIAPVKIKRRPRAEVEAEAVKILARVGLGDKARSYPDQLSGGQQQRVAIARALALRPDLVLFDEVTSALDPETVGEVLAVIRDLVKEGMTSILVTHEMRFAEEISDVVVFTENGLIVDQGTPEDIFQKSTNARIRRFVNGLAGGRTSLEDGEGI